MGGQTQEEAAMSETPTGRFCWYELMTTNPDAAPTLYGAIAGWGTTPFEGADPPYTMWTNGETLIGGLMQLPQEAIDGGAPSHWLVHLYSRVPDVADAVEKVKESGGQVLSGPMEVPGGDMVARCMDPEGVAFAAHSMAQG
jgi:predicted enzyme related to lactoylglutathione lyase